MRKLSTLLLFIAYILVGLIARAQAQTYSLEACVRTALENNSDLKNSQLDIASSEYRIKEIKSALMPTINLSGQFMYYRDVPAQYAPASAFGGPEGEYRKLSLNMAQSTTAGLQMSQNLYNQNVAVGLKTAKVYREVTALQETVTKESLIYNVTTTYYSIQVLSDNLGRLSQNIANLEKTVQINQSLKDNELVSENLHNRMLISLENLKNQYENQKMLLDKNVTLIKFLMNLEIDAPFAAEAFNYNETAQMPAAGDISQRPDMLLQQANIKLCQYDKKSVLAGYYPTLTNSFNLGYTGYYNEFAPFKQINNDWIKTSYMAMTLRIPVFDGFMKQNQVRQKQIAIQKNENRLSMMRHNADKEVQDANNNFIINKNLYENNKKSLELAEKLFASSQSEYENGLTSVTEFLNAQNDLTNARTNYSAALLNLKLAELSLKKANGTLLTNL